MFTNSVRAIGIALAYSAADNKKATTLVSLDISAAFDNRYDQPRHSSQPFRQRVWRRWRNCTLAARICRFSSNSSNLENTLLPRHYGVPRAPRIGARSTALHCVGYVSPVGVFIESFADDDTHLFVAMNANDAVRRSAAVRSWYLHNGLQLNRDKLEVVSHSQYAASALFRRTGAANLTQAEDSYVRFDNRANSVARRATFTRADEPFITSRQRKLWRRALWPPGLTTATLCSAACRSRLNRLYTERKTTCRELSASSATVDPTPNLCYARYSGDLQDCGPHQQGPSNVDAGISATSDMRCLQDIWDRLTRLLTVPITRTDIARRAFSVAAPRVWNTLPDILFMSIGDIRWQISTEWWLEIAQWSQWRANRKPPSGTISLSSAPQMQPRTNLRRVLPPSEYDRRYRKGSCVGCRYDPSDVSFCQIISARYSTFVLALFQTY